VCSKITKIKMEKEFTSFSIFVIFNML